MASSSISEGKLKEGWLRQGGPSHQCDEWRCRWCVLSPTGIRVYTHKTCTNLKANIRFGASSLVTAFSEASAPGYSSAYRHNHYKGFALSVNPDGEPAQPIYYFDDKVADGNKWLPAIEECLRRFRSWKADADSAVATLTTAQSQADISQFDTESEILSILAMEGSRADFRKQLETFQSS